MRGPLILVVLAVLGGACGDDRPVPATPDAGVDGGVEPDATIEPPVTQYCRALSEVICGGLSSCGCRFDTRAYDAAGCVAARTTACVESTAAQASDVAAGRARVDEASLARCVAALQATATACDEASLPEACRDTLLASAALGATCELAGGGLAFCAAGAGVCSPGDNTCVALPASGDACLGGVLCARDLACVAGVCGARGGAGDACEPDTCAGALVCGPASTCVVPGVVDAACWTDEQCAEGLRCAPSETGGTCQAATASGAGCTGPGQCGAERSCVPAPESRTCTAPDGIGDACETSTCDDGLACDASQPACVALPGVDQPCLDGACADGLTCGDGTGVCITLPGQGQACAMGTRFCAEGLGCRESTQTCEVPPGAGQPCLLNPPDYLCAPGFGCDFDAGQTCVAQGAAGAACTSDRGCVATAYCEVSTNTCAARLAAGAACEDGNECQAGHECAFVSGASICRVLPAATEPCLFDCAADLACKGPGGACAPAFCAVR